MRDVARPATCPRFTFGDAWGRLKSSATEPGASDIGGQRRLQLSPGRMWLAPKALVTPGSFQERQVPEDGS
jgi:hypothetical protein